MTPATAALRALGDAPVPAKLPGNAAATSGTGSDEGVGESLGERLPAHFRTPENLICVTLYNEGPETLARTLRSLLVALQHLDATRGSLGPHRGGHCVAIIADGAAQLRPETALLLRRCGLLSSSARPEADSVALYTASRRPAELLEELDRPRVAASHRRLEPAVSFVTCVKAVNRGKLDSHALFFGDLARTLEPEFCHQLDTGTILDPGALTAIVAHLRANTGVAAVAARIASPAPTATSGALESWQFLDFATQLSCGWPVEIVSGHLSVMPGQYSAIRWSAMNMPALGTANPLARYLRGITPGRPLERLMFLAEDRILGSEIILAAGRRWRLDYCPQAVATTDACTAFTELRRQRRRWNNSSGACRLWLLGRWPAEMARPDRSIRRKLHFSLAMLWQVAAMLEQFLAPAKLICSWAVVVHALARGDARLVAVTVGFAALSWICVLQVRQRQPSRAVAALRDIACWGYFATIVLLLATALSPAAAALLAAPSLLTLVAIAFALPRHAAASVRRYAEYWTVNPLLQIVLCAYSLARLDDLSWGTKGRVGLDNGAGERGLRTVRNLILGGWVAANAALGWAGAHAAGWLLADLNPVVEVTALIALALNGPAAALFHVARRWRERRPSAGGRSQRSPQDAGVVQ